MSEYDRVVYSFKNEQDLFNKYSVMPVQGWGLAVAISPDDSAPDSSVI